jgi:small-conductance mechanosensitive channel
MKRGRELFVIFLGILGELGLFFQVYRPIYFIETDIIEQGLISWTIPRLMCIIAMIAMLLFMISVFRGNVKGLLCVSYAVLLLYQVIVLFAMLSQKDMFVKAVNEEKLKLNVVIYIGTAIILILNLGIFILREKGAIRMIPNISALMLFVILGQFITHGLFVVNDSLAFGTRSLLCGVCSMMPYVAIYVFEKTVVESTDMEYR